MSVSELVAHAEGLATCTHHLRELAAGLPDDDAVVAEALLTSARERRGGAFQRLVLAVMEAQRSFPADVLVQGASLLPDMRALATAVVRCEGDAASALIAAARDGRLGDWDAYAVYQAAWWARHQEPAADTAAVVAEARAVARRPLGAEAQQVLSALALFLDDRGLRLALRAEGHLVDDKDAAAAVRDLETWFTAPPLLDLPARPPPPPVSLAPRKATKVGRNEACPCGSGLKHKKCCWGKASAAPAEAPPLDAERLQTLAGWELCRLTVAQVPAALQDAWIEQLLLGAEYDRAAQVLAELPSEGRDKTRADALRWATALGRIDAVRTLVGLVPEDQIGGGTRMLQLRDDPAAQLALAEQRALALADDRTGELAFDLLDGGLPGLALHVARGAFAVAADADVAVLLQALLQVRDRAGLDPVDPLEERLLPWVQGGRLVEDSGLTAALAAKTEEADRLRQELGRVHEAWKAEREAAALPTPEPEPQVPVAEVDPEVLRQLRAKVASLVDELKVRTAERAELRSDVARSEEALALATAAPAATVTADPDEPVDEGPGGPHPVRIPVVPGSVVATLGSLPEPVQRSALELLGRLAAGREDAFRGSRPLRGRSWLWRQKIGRSYRMFFTLADDRLEVVDVIHRQDLEKRIRELS